MSASITFKELRPILWTNQLDETISFYETVLGFTCGEKNEEWGWASLYRDHTSIMLSKPVTETSFAKASFTGSFYFTVDNVDILWRELKEKTNVCYEPETFPWEMREFAIYDNNGYILQFGQQL